MRSRIYTGHVSHARQAPVRHSFRYPLYYYALDLEELPELDRRVLGFGHNRLAVVALHERDHLRGSRTETLRGRVLERLSPAVAGRVERIELLTNARYFNYVFNPVSFYYCYDSAGAITAIVAEVNNTFGETHLYVLEDLRRDARTGLLRQAQPKSFHVSPFMDIAGDYDFWCSEIGGKLDIRINVVKDGNDSFLTRLVGEATPLTSPNLARTLAQYPVSAALTMPRILWQAARLHYQRGLPVYTKPAPSSAMTIAAAPPTLLQSFAQSTVLTFLERANRGALTLHLPDRSTVVFGSPQGEGPRAEMFVRDHSFFTRCLLSADVGFGESYTAGEWDTPDLPRVIEWFVANRDTADDGDYAWAWLGRLWNRASHLLNSNTLRGSRRNISAHYDLSNEFFALFLDDCMTYSSALYRSPDESLAQAQRNKLREMIRKADIRPESHVLEIGCGWGSFAIEAVRETGCRVTGITLSERQLELARRRVTEAGLSDRIDLQLTDYRRVQGSFDRIVSIEMLEAVGHENLPDYFAALDRLLRPNGLVAIQTISIPDQRYDEYRKRCDWIQKHIFPGAVLPSVTSIASAMTSASKLMIEEVDNIGYHYAPTLKVWRERFMARREEVLALGFSQEFIRTWEYYLSYCETAFGTRTLGNLQLVLTRANNDTLTESEAARWNKQDRSQQERPRMTATSLA